MTLRCTAPRRTGRRALTVLVVAATLSMPTLGVSGQEAVALLGTRPMDGAVLEASEVPPTARAVFAVPVTPGEPAVVVHDADGEQVDLGDAGAGASPAVVEASLPERLPAGAYLAEWSVVAADGSSLEGSWSFEVAAEERSWLGGWLSPGDLAVAASVAILVCGAMLWVRRRREGG